LYDALLKSTIFGPAGMAVCRFLNIMLGASGAAAAEVLRTWPQRNVAAALAVYVLGVTWFARNETGEASRRQLSAGLGLSAVGILMNLQMMFSLKSAGPPATGAAIALGLIGCNILLRGFRAIRVGQPKILQQTVGFLLLNIIFLDAAVTFGLTGSAPLSAAIVILVIPATVLRKIIPMS
ncbi:MAG: hypothetical protein KDA89_02090, partial [Planctomycetaceae bacterium]|nr:hypothetical protein [Planctomycetaceae bacterium]